MVRQLFKKLLPVGAALLAANLGRRSQNAAAGASADIKQEPVATNRVPSQSGGRPSTFGPIVSSALSEAFLPKRTSVLGKMIGAAFPIAVARYLSRDPNAVDSSRNGRI